MNTGSWLPEEEDINGLSDNFFGDLMNCIDLPLEDIETANDEEDWDARFQDLGLPPSDVLTSFSSEFTHGSTCKGQPLGVPKPIPVLSSSSEVSSTIGSSLPDVKVSKLFTSSSPDSVLENVNGSVLFQNSNRAQKLAFPIKSIRSKRKRPTPLRFRVLKKQFTLDQSEFENSAKKKLKNHPAHSVSHSTEPFKADGIVRKCTHCETTKTPQWREGPNGPKTLCNACGVRFRSGRLVPEYRPASSPTFIPTMHSNLHRKIIEMKRKGDDQFDNKMIHTVTSQG